MKKEFYRNIRDFTSREGIRIDAGSLWEKKGWLLVLVDEDQYATALYSDIYFVKEEKTHK